MSYKYQICGFNLLSQVRLPILRKKDFGDPDFEIILKNNIIIKLPITNSKTSLDHVFEFLSNTFTLPIIISILGSFVYFLKSDKTLSS